MEDISPLLVAREFVRQYYTTLNERPESLHRFVTTVVLSYTAITLYHLVIN